MARKGEEVELEPRMIQVHHLEVLEWAPPEVVVDVHCSSGTYVRSLANDLGETLGTGAYLVGLRRTKSGRFTLRDAVPLRKLQEAFQRGNWYQYLIPAAEALGDWEAGNSTPMRWKKCVTVIVSRLILIPSWIAGCAASARRANWWRSCYAWKAKKKAPANGSPRRFSSNLAKPVRAAQSHLTRLEAFLPCNITAL